MHKECVEAITNAAAEMGTKLTQADLKGIEDRILKHKRRMARDDRDAYLAMPEDVRMQEAANRAAIEIKAEAIAKKRRVVGDALREARRREWMSAMEGNTYSLWYKKKKVTATEAIVRTLATKTDFASRVLPVEDLAKGVWADSFSKLSALFDLQDEGSLFNLFVNKEGHVAFVKELYDQDSGNPLAKKAVEGVRNVIDDLVNRINYLGGDIKRLADWHHPQKYDQVKLLKLGKPSFVELLLPRVDRKKYMDPETGAYMDDARMREFLEHSYDSLVGVPKADVAVNRGQGRRIGTSGERQLFYPDWQSWSEVNDVLGGGNMYELVTDHIRQLSQEVALMEYYGSNPRLAMEKDLLDAAKQDGARGVDPSQTNHQANYARELLDFYNGYERPIKRLWMHQATVGLKNYINAALMGMLPISQIVDNATMVQNAKMLGIKPARMLMDLAKVYDPRNTEDRAALRRLGLMAMTAGAEFARWGDETSKIGFSGKLATAVIQMSGSTKMTEIEKGMFGAGMADVLHQLTRQYKTLDELHASDAQILKTKGITEADWKIWQMSEPDSFMEHRLLSAPMIERVPVAEVRKNLGLGSDAAAQNALYEARMKLLGVLHSEQDIAVVTPGLEDRFLVKNFMGLRQRGTWGGAINELVFQYKLFPVAYTRRHYDRIADMPANGRRAGAAVSLITLSTFFGALALAIGDMLTGKDPRRMFNADDPASMAKFGVAAFMKGGGMGVYTDFLFAEHNKYGQGVMDVMAGPGIKFFDNVVRTTGGNVQSWLAGEETHIGADAFKTFKPMVPFQNFWATRLVMDRMLYDNVQEFVNPGSLARMQNRVEDRYNTEFWWQPGESAPERAPDLSNIAGSD